MFNLSIKVVYGDGSGCKCSGKLTREQCYSYAVKDLQKAGADEDKAHKYATIFANTSEPVKININGNVFTCKPVQCSA